MTNKGQHLTWVIIVLTVFTICVSATRKFQNMKDLALAYSITTDWQNVSVETSAHVHIRFSMPNEMEEKGLVIDIDAPWYNDTLPPNDPGRVDGLWDFEVVEVFFLGDNENYLELEFGPGGHYLVYYLEGYRNVTNSTLLLSSYKAVVLEDAGRWIGRAIIPINYFPPNVSLFNAYAIHGEGQEDLRTYMALFPASFNSSEGPDFHQLDWFGDVDLSGIISEE